MTRFALAANETASAQPHVSYVVLAEFDFTSGVVRVNSGDRYYTHNGQQFAPLGTFGGIGSVRENGNLSPEKLDFTLSGVDNSLLGVTLNEDYHGRDVRVWLGYLDESYQFVATPEILWEGLMDTMSIRTEQNSSTISLTAENRLIRWNTTPGWLYTFEHQRLFDATDDFFDQVSVLANKVVKWNQETVTTGASRGGRPRGPRQ